MISLEKTRQWSARWIGAGDNHINAFVKALPAPYFRREFRNIFRHKGDHAGGGSQGHGNKDHEPENDCGKNIQKFSTAFHDNYLLPK